MSLRFPLAVLLLAVFTTPLHADPLPTEPSDLRFPLGEKLTYDARVWKGIRALGLSVGESTFEVKEAKDGPHGGSILLEARAQGGALGYEVDATIESFIDPETNLPVKSNLLQKGSEPNHKQMIFEDGQAVYVKKKHCNRWKTCEDPDHIEWVTRSKSLFGSAERVREHCREESCRSPKHVYWQERHRHDLDGSTYDMLSMVYVARALDLSLEGEAQTLRLVNSHDIWDVKVRAVARETVTVPAGKFRTLRIEISPKPATDDTELREEFQGLFGIKGNIKIWIDEETKIPVRIRGVVPFGVDLNMDISLTEKRQPQA